jgi:hypothetical protein
MEACKPVLFSAALFIDEIRGRKDELTYGSLAFDLVCPNPGEVPFRQPA